VVGAASLRRYSRCKVHVKRWRGPSSPDTRFAAVWRQCFGGVAGPARRRVSDDRGSSAHIAVENSSTAGPRLSCPLISQGRDPKKKLHFVVVVVLFAEEKMRTG